MGCHTCNRGKVPLFSRPWVDKSNTQQPLINWKNTSVLVFQLLVLISEILILLFNVNLGGTRRRGRHQLSVNQYSYVDFDYK